MSRRRNLPPTCRPPATRLRGVGQLAHTRSVAPTRSATVLTRAIATEGFNAVAAGLNPQELRKGIQIGVDHVVSELKKMSKPVTNNDEIRQVATISANGDVAVGQLIADGFERVGKDGVITIKDGQVLEDQLEVTEGMKFDRGYISPFFVNQPKSEPPRASTRSPQHSS